MGFFCLVDLILSFSPLTFTLLCRLSCALHHQPQQAPHHHPLLHTQTKKCAWHLWQGWVREGPFKFPPLGCSLWVVLFLTILQKKLPTLAREKERGIMGTTQHKKKEKKGFCGNAWWYYSVTMISNCDCDLIRWVKNLYIMKKCDWYKHNYHRDLNPCQSPSNKIEITLLTVAGERKCVLVPATMDKHVIMCMKLLFCSLGSRDWNIEFPFFFLSCYFCCFALSLSLSLNARCCEIVEGNRGWKWK